MMERVADQVTSAPSLDDLFRRSVARKPDADALADPVDRARVTGHTPRRLTYAQVDRAVANLAAHFVDAGLPAGSIIAIQLPNTVEATLAMLAAVRAGLVVALLPQLWRQAELTDALNRIGARAILGTSRIDGVDHAEIAMNAAAEVFSVRHVCMFGNDVPEGMAALDDIVFASQPLRTIQDRDPRRANIITFDVTSEGLRAVPRTQMQVIAGGLAVFLETGVSPGARLLSAVMPSSFAGVCASTVTWLLSGGSLTFHHPFDTETLTRQLVDERCETLIAPAPLALRLAEAGAFADAAPSLRQVIGLWRTAEQVASSNVWHAPSRFSDLYAFGEAGLFAIPRDADGGASPVLPGSPRRRSQTTSAAASEAFVTKEGTLGLRGAMIPIAAYAPQRRALEGAPVRNLPDHVDTGYAARLDRQTGALCITAPPSGVVNVGGYRFLANDLNDWAHRLPQGGMLTALPDRVSGHRLAGRASDNARARTALAQLGLNPLMVEAFRDRSTS
jgi:non-ribosomal peptide synthetase component F